MAAVARLLTYVDLDDADDGGPDGGRMSVSARHEAVLGDGRRVLLLDDRGWSGQLAPAEDVERTARVVVGPDEPFEGRTRADMEADHWAHLARILRRQGVAVDAADIGALPHDVEVSDRVRARIARG